MFQYFFLTKIARPTGKSLEAILSQYDDSYGFPEVGLPARYIKISIGCLCYPSDCKVSARKFIKLEAIENFLNMLELLTLVMPP